MRQNITNEERTQVLRCGTVEAILAAGAEVLYLPPYSPDLNPIEHVFSKLKSHLRRIAERTVSGLKTCCLELAKTFTPSESRNYIHHCGYTAKLK